MSEKIKMKKFWGIPEIFYCEDCGAHNREAFRLHKKALRHLRKIYQFHYDDVLQLDTIEKAIKELEI